MTGERALDGRQEGDAAVRGEDEDPREHRAAIARARRAKQALEEE